MNTLLRYKSTQYYVQRMTNVSNFLPTLSEAHIKLLEVAVQKVTQTCISSFLPSFLYVVSLFSLFLSLFYVHNSGSFHIFVLRGYFVHMCAYVCICVCVCARALWWEHALMNSATFEQPSKARSYCMQATTNPKHSHFCI